MSNRFWGWTLFSWVVITICTITTFEYGVQPKHYAQELKPPVEIFIQEGIASWYGHQFHGKKASDGSIYNMHQFTAASRFLAFGVRVRVVSVETGRSVVVTITDRGPYVKGRAIDLSKVAAEQLGMKKQGLMAVWIFAIEANNGCGVLQMQ